MKIVGNEDGSIKHKFRNPVDNSREVFLISDIPPLLKTEGNCLENAKKNDGMNSYIII